MDTLIKLIKTYLLILFIGFQGIFSQSQDSITSIEKPKKERAIRKSKMYFAFDASRSFLSEPNVRFNGIKIGVELMEKHRLGLAIYGLTNQVRFMGEIDQNEYPTSTDTLYFNFTYASVFYDHVWLRTKRWELTTPFHIGMGGIDISYLDTTGVRSSPFLSTNSVMMGFGGSAQFKVLRWVALGTGAGYRQMLTRDENIGKSLNAPFYQLQLKILLGEIYRMTFKRDELEEW
jgi:hypothetical protein